MTPVGKAAGPKPWSELSASRAVRSERFGREGDERGGYARDLKSQFVLGNARHRRQLSRNVFKKRNEFLDFRLDAFA